MTLPPDGAQKRRERSTHRRQAAPARSTHRRPEAPGTSPPGTSPTPGRSPNLLRSNTAPSPGRNPLPRHQNPAPRPTPGRPGNAAPSDPGTGPQDSPGGRETHLQIARVVRPGEARTPAHFSARNRSCRRIFAEKIGRKISDIRPSTNRICFLGQGPPRAPPGFARENQDINLFRAPVAKLRSSRVNRKTYVGPPLILLRARV